MEDTNVALKKLQRYCAYQERCHQEVRSKLLKLHIYGDQLEEIIMLLIQDGYLNEERFARVYAGGKFRIKGWGKNKIKRHLIAKNVSSYCIKKALEEIDLEAYRTKLHTIIEAQIRLRSHETAIIRKDKAIKYAYSRGYEPNLIFEIIKEFEINSDILF